MNKPTTKHVWLAVCCLLSLGVAWRNTSSLDGTEFSGGWLTGQLLSMAELGMLLFLLGFFLTFFLRRLSTAISLIASLLCLPLYTYFIVPAPFGRVFGFGHPSKVPLPNVHWDVWSVIGTLLSVVTIYICVYRFRKANDVSEKSEISAAN